MYYLHSVVVAVRSEDFQKDVTFLQVKNKLEYWEGLKRSGRCSGLMVSALVSGSSGPGLSPGQGHCVVFLGKTLYSHSASLHPGV